MRNLAFVHGRGQQGREADALRRRWAAGLNKGLTAAGRDPLGTGEIDAIEFPFYGDVLWAEVVQARAAVPDVAALDAVPQVDPGLPDAVNRRQVAVLNAMAGELGLPAALAPAAALAMPTSALLRGVLEWVANHSVSTKPSSGGSCATSPPTSTCPAAGPRSRRSSARRCSPKPAAWSSGTASAGWSAPSSQEHSIEHHLAHPDVVATVIADHLGWHPSG